MSASPRSGPPSPEDFARQFQALLRQHLQQTQQPSSHSDLASAPPEEPGGESQSAFRFDLKPREVKVHLDRFVIQQDEAKKVLSVALCDHYHHVRLAMEGREHPNYTKQNII